MHRLLLLAVLFAGVLSGPAIAGDAIQHDADHYVLLEQHGEGWAKEDAVLDERLAALRKKFGTPPNIVHIMWDDAGYGEVGHPLFSRMTGLPTPRIEDMAAEGMSFVRMYTEIACTQTRSAAQTGRQSFRNGMFKVVFPPDGMGLAASEKTIAEVLSEEGYATAFYGKWHLGDVEESYPFNQGYDETLFMPYNQWPPMMYNEEAEQKNYTSGFSKSRTNEKFTLDRQFRAYDYIFSVEGRKGEKGREWKKASHDNYDDFNREIHKRSLDFIRTNADAKKPFMLNYYTNTPHDYGRHEDFVNVGRGTEYSSGMAKFDRDVGEVLDTLKELGIAENTLVILMADNGPMHEVRNLIAVGSLFRGGKGDYLEGGVRVPAFAWWPGTIEKGSVVGDIIHVTDLFTTFARLGGATAAIPTDRVIDGVDQTALLMNGETRSRRDYVHIYRGPFLSATVKQQFKRHWVGARPGLMGLEFYDLYKDPREEHPVMAQMLWSWTAFDAMKTRHIALNKKYPHTAAVRGKVGGGLTLLPPVD